MPAVALELRRLALAQLDLEEDQLEVWTQQQQLDQPVLPRRHTPERRFPRYLRWRPFRSHLLPAPTYGPFHSHSQPVPLTGRTAQRRERPNRFCLRAVGAPRRSAGRPTGRFLTRQTGVAKSSLTTDGKAIGRLRCVSSVRPFSPLSRPKHGRRCIRVVGFRGLAVAQRGEEVEVPVSTHSALPVPVSTRRYPYRAAAALLELSPAQ